MTKFDAIAVAVVVATTAFRWLAVDASRPGRGWRCLVDIAGAIGILIAAWHVLVAAHIG
jgi:threonine dehydrogenase-like Zn-dependent dehydrogenase